LYELHFADSELLAPRWAQDSLVLVFAAAQVRPRVWPEAPAPLGHPAQAPGLGHVRGLTLHLSGARVRGDLAAAIGRLADGCWQRDGQPAQRRLWVPQAVAQAVQLSLALANGTAIEIQATGLRADFSAKPDYRESLAC
jgi:hypothetical protein